MQIPRIRSYLSISCHWFLYLLLSTGVVGLLIGGVVSPGEFQTEEPADRSAVIFPTSCAEEVQPGLEQGLSLLHHMDYWNAEQQFREIIEQHPNCGMAYWGAAMTFFHPLWQDLISPEHLEEGQRLLKKGRSVEHLTDRERAYFETLEAFYRPDNIDQTERFRRLHAAFEKLHRSYPDDIEAELFYALVHMAHGVPPDGQRLAYRKDAGRIAERIMKDHPQHPGGHHYAIHAYDHPEMVDRVVEVARRYGRIAPSTVHALHMGSHIFIKVGLWEEAIDRDTRAAEIAKAEPIDGALSAYYLHSVDYLAYAALQIADDQRVKDLVEELETLEGPVQDEPASAFTMASVSARYAVERRRWTEAATLERPLPEQFPWSKYPWARSNLGFARALGAAQSGNLDQARENLRKLETLRDEIGGIWEDYWGPKVEVQIDAVRAVIAHKEGETGRALSLLEKAGEREEQLGPHPISPKSVIPVNELRADLLRRLTQFEEALRVYEAVLDRHPNRFQALYGAAAAAEQAGLEEKSRNYAKRLMDQCTENGRTSSSRSELERIRRLAQK